MAEHFLKTDSRNTQPLDPTLTRGSTFVKLTGQNLTDLQRDDTLTRIHDHASVKRRTADDSRPIPQQTDPDTYYDEDGDDRGSALSGLALARLQHRAKKSTTNGNATTSQRLQERRGSNPDRSTRLTCDDLTSHMTSEMTSHREARTIERPTSSWASKSGRRPNYTESGWEVDDEDFLVDSRIEKMAINEPNGYTVRRASVNEATCHSPQGKNALSLPTGNQEKLTRRASDSSRARSYKEVAKELRREAKLAGSHKKRDENHSNGGSSISMTDGESARMRAVSRLSHATPQLASESTSSMGSTARHLPRKLNPLPVSQVTGTDMALDEEEEEMEEEEEKERQMARQHKARCGSWGNNGSVDEPAPRRRGSREQDSSAMFFSNPNTPEKNIIPKPKLKPIARK